MCKMEWFEEQRTAKQAAVDNAVKLTTAEWRSKLDTAVEQEVEARLEEGELSSTDICLSFLEMRPFKFGKMCYIVKIIYYSILIELFIIRSVGW